MKFFFKKITIPMYICIFSVLLLSGYISFKLYSKGKISDETFRIHVVASSNKIEDQIIKLKISEKIENYLEIDFANLNNKQEIYDKIYSNIPQFFKIINEELKNNNVNYSSKIKLGKIHYDEKESLNLKMEAGSYDSIQILLGDANGKNYWNLIFPNKDDIDNLKYLDNILPDISTLYENEEVETEPKYTFKLLEILNNIF